MCRSTGSPDGLPSTTGRRSSAGAPAGHHAESGFTLLEVLVAFAVLAVMLVPILQVFGGGLGMTQTARGYAEGVLLARSKLAELGVAKDLREGESSGEFEERGYRVSITGINPPTSIAGRVAARLAPATRRNQRIARDSPISAVYSCERG